MRRAHSAALYRSVMFCAAALSRSWRARSSERSACSFSVAAPSRLCCTCSARCSRAPERRTSAPCVRGSRSSPPAQRRAAPRHTTLARAMTIRAIRRQCCALAHHPTGVLLLHRSLLFLPASAASLPAAPSVSSLASAAGGGSERSERKSIGRWTSMAIRGRHVPRLSMSSEPPRTARAREARSARARTAP
eukprot:COSAG03_NODE_4715_length_1458_cov_1.559235_2_plen_191_part_00